MKRKRERRRKIKNFLLKFVMIIVFFVCGFSLCAIDSESPVFFIIFIITGGILFLYAYAKGYVGVM